MTIPAIIGSKYTCQFYFMLVLYGRQALSQRLFSGLSILFTPEDVTDLHGSLSACFIRTYKHPSQE